MISFLVVAIPVIAAVIWGFFGASPSNHDIQRVRLVNASIIALALIGSLIVTVWVRTSMAGTMDSHWWPVVSFIYSAVLFPIVLIVGGLVRNWLIFR